MKDEERDLVRRLTAGPAPRPPVGLLEKLKADIPERLPANVRPFRRPLPAVALRVAASLFVVGGALFVVTHARKDVPPAESVAAPALSKVAEEASRVSTDSSDQPAEAKAGTSERRAEPAAAPEEPRKQKADAKPGGDASTSGPSSFAPAMPRPQTSAPAVAQDASEPAAPPRPEPERALAKALPPAPPAAVERKARDAAEKKAEAETLPPQESAVGNLAPEDRAAKGAGAPSPAGMRAAPARGEPIAVSPTSGSLLGEVLDAPSRPVAARDGARVLALLSLARAAGAELSGGRVLSAAALPEGGLVVLVEVSAEEAALRSGDERTSVALAHAAASPGEAPAELRLALLAWRLERARVRGDAAERSGVAREAEGLARTDARAARLVRLARP